MRRSLSSVLSATFLIAGIAFVPLASQAQDRDQGRDQDRKAPVTYHDAKHKEDHEWNAREDQAYRIWQTNTHRKEMEFERRKANEQQAYWNWRRSHSDAALKIDIR